MKKMPSNTREQCAYDSGCHKARMVMNLTAPRDEQWVKWRDQRNPHKKGSAEHEFWNEGFDNAQ